MVPLTVVPAVPMACAVAVVLLLSTSLMVGPLTTDDRMFCASNLAWKVLAYVRSEGNRVLAALTMAVAMAGILMLLPRPKCASRMIWSILARGLPAAISATIDWYSGADHSSSDWKLTPPSVTDWCAA